MLPAAHPYCRLVRPALQCCVTTDCHIPLPLLQGFHALKGGSGSQRRVRRSGSPKQPAGPLFSQVRQGSCPCSTISSSRMGSVW